jgi:hypothetical protein
MLRAMHSDERFLKAEVEMVRKLEKHIEECEQALTVPHSREELTFDFLIRKVAHIELVVHNIATYLKGRDNNGRGL